MQTKMNLAVLFGGKSAEHDISIRSANNIIRQINQEKYNIILIGIDRQGRWFMNTNLKRFVSTEENLSFDGFVEAISFNLDNTQRIYNQTSQTYFVIDIVHPVLHGPFGEDGAVQGLLKTLQIPYVGPDVLGSSVGMDKEIMKRILRDVGIEIGPFLSFYKEEPRPTFNTINNDLGLPVYIKPANMGSSIGISKVSTEDQFSDALEEAFKYDRKILIEANIIGREVECAVLGNEDPKASILGEVLVYDDFYAFDTKYESEDGASVQIPAIFDKAIIQKTQEIAIKTFKALGCEGLGRVDVFIQEDGKVLVNEINTLPGFTSVSMYPLLWKASGIEYSDLLENLYDLAISRHERSSNLL